MNVEERLQEIIDDYVSLGATQGKLGIQKMPKGYALMLNIDRTHYYWINVNRDESGKHWDKWAIYRYAKNHFKIITALNKAEAKRNRNRKVNK